MTQDEALMILKTGANVFLTGEPGSGKTHTVNAYVEWLRERDVEPSITASTGIAATHIGGLTIHSWSGIGIKRALTKYDLDTISQNKRIVDRVGSTRVLIIDEVSMLSADTLQMVDAVCREIRLDERPFGGMQVVLVGDFFQLPPVVQRPQYNEQESFDAFKTNSVFAFASSAWERLNPLVCYLSEQHRQEDEDFLGLLSAIRRDDFSEVHHELLASRNVQPEKGGATRLYSHNADVDALNNSELAKLPSATNSFEMISSGSDTLVAGLKRGCLSPETLILKEGARVMFTKNDGYMHKFVNGTLGIVVKVKGQDGYPVIKTTEGKLVTVEPMEWSVSDGGRVLARINQIPLRLAWAMTVHKSQGMSLDSAHMDLSNAFEYGQGYVALSRVRTLKGLTLAGFNARAVAVHPEILAKDEDFRTQSSLSRDGFSGLPASELATMHANFIKACGGKQVPEELQKTSTKKKAKHTKRAV